MIKGVFIDTSGWISYFLSNQFKHSTIKKIIKQLKRDRVTLYISNDIIDETVTRLVYHTNPQIVIKFIDFIAEGIKANYLIQLWVDEEIQSQAFELVKKYSEHKLSLTDATTIALVQKYNIESVISLDSDFLKIGIPTLP